MRTNRTCEETASIAHGCVSRVLELCIDRPDMHLTRCRSLWLKFCSTHIPGSTFQEMSAPACMDGVLTGASSWRAPHWCIIMACSRFLGATGQRRFCLESQSNDFAQVSADVCTHIAQMCASMEKGDHVSAMTIQTSLTSSVWDEHGQWLVSSASSLNSIFCLQDIS